MISWNTSPTGWGQCCSWDFFRQELLEGVGCVLVLEGVKQSYKPLGEFWSVRAGFFGVFLFVCFVRNNSEELPKCSRRRNCLYIFFHRAIVLFGVYGPATLWILKCSCFAWNSFFLGGWDIQCLICRIQSCLNSWLCDYRKVLAGQHKEQDTLWAPWVSHHLLKEKGINFSFLCFLGLFLIPALLVWFPSEGMYSSLCSSTPHHQKRVTQELSYL